MITLTAHHAVCALIEMLEQEDAARREAAIARLIIIGPRAIGRLVTASEQTSNRGTLVAILRVLEASGDERALVVARRAIGQGGDPAAAAVAVLRDLLHRGGSAHTDALDLLLSVSADPAIERRVRAAAAEALDGAPDDIRRAVTVARDALPISVGDAVWQDAVDGRLPDDPASLGDIVEAHAERAPLAEILKTVEHVGARERHSRPGLRDGWRRVRGALHQALALRNSRIALYDLRETLEQATEPLPSSFLGTLQLVGDESCLEPIAVAIARAPAEHERWRRQLARAFQEIVKRDRISKKNASFRRAIAKEPSLGATSRG